MDFTSFDYRNCRPSSTDRHERDRGFAKTYLDTEPGRSRRCYTKAKVGAVDQVVRPGCSPTLDADTAVVLVALNDTTTNTQTPPAPCSSSGCRSR